jgi:transcriptional regulator with XRE-family HTH domain
MMVPSSGESAAGPRDRGTSGAGSRFAELLAELRARAGLSQSALARRVDADASYLNRLEAGAREPPRRPLVEALAVALDLGSLEADELLVAAGHLPQALARLGPLDPTIRLVAEVLADVAIPAGERAEFRQILALVARRWPAHAWGVQASPNGGEDTC